MVVNEGQLAAISNSIAEEISTPKFGRRPGT